MEKTVKLEKNYTKPEEPKLLDWTIVWDGTGGPDNVIRLEPGTSNHISIEVNDEWEFDADDLRSFAKHFKLVADDMDGKGLASDGKLRDPDSDVFKVIHPDNFEAIRAAREGLIEGFSWSGSCEGWQYWHEVHERLCEIVDQYDVPQPMERPY